MTWWLSLEDQPSSGWPSTNKNNKSLGKVCHAVNEDHHRIINEMFVVTGLSRSLFEWMLTDLKMKCVCKKFKPHWPRGSMKTLIRCNKFEMSDSFFPKMKWDIKQHFGYLGRVHSYHIYERDNETNDKKETAKTIFFF